MKKIVGYFVLILINYLLISLIVFSFSLISLKNNKVYDLFWIKFVQKNIYHKTGFRNIFQYNSDCVQFDSELIYVPKIGECIFSNAEFNTKLNFDKYKRLNLVDDSVKKNDEIIAVLGDSIAMGWGVNNNETFSYQLQKLSGKKVINLGVSSYGTIREIKRLKKNENYNQIDTIIIQYHPNDYGENISMNPQKTYSEKEFKNFFNSHKDESSSFKMLFKLFKKTLRLSVSHLSDLLFPESNKEIIYFNKHLELLQKIISKNFINEDKKIIVFTTVEPWERFEYDKAKKYQNFDLIEIKFKKHHKFIIDDHPNKLGHIEIAKILDKFLSTNMTSGK